MGRTLISPEQIAQMREMKRQGYFLREITERFDVSRSVVSKKTADIPSITRDRKREDSRSGYRTRYQSAKPLKPPKLEPGKHYRLRQRCKEYQKTDRVYEYLGTVAGQKTKWLFRSVAGRWMETFILSQLTNMSVREVP